VLVYGDPKFEADLGVLHAQLCALTRDALEHPYNLDRLRALLIACGQVEQGVHDTLVQAIPAGEAEPLIAAFRRATGHAAEAFYSLAYAQAVPLPLPGADAPAALNQMLQRLEGMANLPNIVVAVKLPEGFSFHAMYPEQYAVAAGQWLAEHTADRHTHAAVVVGIRSIGTTLAAVVATVLRAAGWQVHSFTVRPNGHPFARTVDLGDMSIAPSTLGLVVDEGPGISGSSMAATAASLVMAGIKAQNIAFLPGHANEPGGAGSPEVQNWWQRVPRYVASSESLAFDRLPLQQALAATLNQRVIQVDNVSGGVWRRFVYTDEADWPATCNYFERVKYLCTFQDGTKVLFKFLGLAAGSPSLKSTTDCAAVLLRQRATQGLAPPVLASVYGFVGTEWIEGEPLTCEMPQQEMAEVLGTYIARVAGPRLDDAEFTSATDALLQMLYVNTTEALGEAPASKVKHLRPASDCPRAAYGDGHLQPYEWTRNEAGQIRKVDGVGHDCDHTLVGKQPVVWDIAGAIVEWHLNPQAVEHLLAAYAAAGGRRFDPGTLHFYRLAYLAFRAGQCALGAEMHDPYERERLLTAYATYRQRLIETLG
jgi:hypothetical protein